jgi:hypothetical protein
MCLVCGTDRTAGLWVQACAAAGHDSRDWSARGFATLRPILAAHGLELLVRPGDLRIATRGGRQMRIRDLDGVWDAAETLLGHPIDPLSSVTLAAVAEPAS